MPFVRSVASERYSRGRQTKSPVFPVHAVSPDDAIDYLLKIRHEERRVSAIVCDNHMKDDDFDSVDGDDFIRLITGNLAYCFRNPVLEKDEVGDFDRFSTLEQYCGGAKTGVMELLDERFGDNGVKNYLDFVNYCFDGDNDPALVMLCGSPREVNRTGFDDVYLVQKSIQGPRNGLTKRYVPCERIVLDILIEKGVLPRNLTSKVISEHSRLSPQVPPQDMCFRPLKKPHT